MIKNRCYRIEREKLEESIGFCIANVTVILDKTTKIIDKNSDNSIALGLYTFAIEEFGRAILLREYLKENKKTYSVSKDIFESHEMKFRKAVEKLPMECVNPVYGVEISNNTSPDIVRIPVTPKGHEVAFAPATTGTAMIVGDAPIDLLTRMSCFFLDWDDSKKKWKNKPKVISGSLERGIWKLNQYVKSWSLSEQNDSKIK